MWPCLAMKPCDAISRIVRTLEELSVGELRLWLSKRAISSSVMGLEDTIL